VLNSHAQLRSQHEYKQHQQRDNTGQNKLKTKKISQLRLFIFKREFLKISVDLQTAFAAEARRAQGQRLEEEMNIVKLHRLPVGIYMQTV
jgi:hypothetical protein